MRSYLLLLFVVFGLTFNVDARRGPDSYYKNGDTKSVGSESDYSKAGCPPSDAKLFMEFNDVRALIEAGGALWQDRQTGASSYEVPSGSGNHVLYSGSIWMGGVDVNNQLKLAAILFRQGNDFWTGPLSVNVGTGDYDPSQPVGYHSIRDFGAATIDADVCIQYDQFFTISKAEVINYTMAFECSQDPNCEETFPVTNQAIQRINNWPAHGDVSRGQDFYLAPFYDYPSQGSSGDGIYDPSQGDVPWFDDILGRDDIQCGIDRRVTLFGDVSHWWVFNDKGNIHTETGADPIGMEIHAQAFSFATNDAVNQMTFYNYEMINRSTQTLENTYFTQYADPDVGDANDDYVGCDVSRGLGYAYNGDNLDVGQSGSDGYGNNPPAVGIDFFEGPYQDPDGLDNPGPRKVYNADSTFTIVRPTVQDAIDSLGIVYGGIGLGYSDGVIDNERFGMRRFNYFNRSDLAPLPSMSDPVGPGDFYNYMTGFWLDNSNIVYGGNGHTGSVGATTVPTSYCYPGDSDPLHWATEGQDMGFEWSETDIDGSANSNDDGDRRFLQSAGPFTLKPGAVNNLTVGVVFGRAYSGNAFASVDVLLKNDTKAQALFDNCFEIMNPPQAPVLEIVELENELILMIDNPYGNNLNENYAEEDDINIPDFVDGKPADKIYRFEGYQIYQMRDSESKISDIGNPDKVRLVAQCDVKNDVSRIINFEFNEALGYSVPIEKVDGENRGIQHSFQVTSDMFTNNTLVNHKTYYYVAVAYAFNEFKKYDPEDATKLDGQKIPYISSRMAADGSAIKAVAAVPHTPVPSSGGTITKLPYGSSPQITTLDGIGNGNRVIDLTPATEEYIVKNGSIDTPTYLEGRGPIDVKVIDPLNIIDGYYVLTMKDYDEYSLGDYSRIDSALWVIERYSEKGGELLETVASNRTIDQINEQLIPEWGISVTILQDRYICGAVDPSGNCLNELAAPIEATLTFSDSSKRWLTGIPDVDSYNPLNWISAGSYKPKPGEINPQLGLNNPGCYEDIQNRDEDQHFAGLLGGTVTLGRYARGNECGYTPIGIPTSIGISEISYRGIASNNSYTSSRLQSSVDVVITTDKSKWTRCPVIELGNDPNLNVNNGLPGLLRKSPSVDKNGNQPGDAGYNASQANPSGTTPTGMGWFPGYAIDVQTGRRLNMAFAENSFLAGQNGADMIWNPTSNLFSDNGTPLLGGQHVVYVFGRPVGEMPAYDEGMYLYNKLSEETPSAYRDVYRKLAWVMNPLLVQDHEMLESDVRLRLRINKEYAEYDMTGSYGGAPTYAWSMDRYATIENDEETLASALDIINVVPNPYYAFSEYEEGRLDTKVKITNLPDRCKVRIYNTSGKLIRSFDKDSPITSIDWDLKNDDNIPVASGVYLIHVHVEGIGDRVVKFFGGMREPDLENL